MVTITHKGETPDDIITCDAETNKDALRKLLEKRGVEDIAELEPVIFETRWC